ncbi:kinase-like domain-containing protein [Aspergillus alliaceus]|uniref:Kinase-like domain-containing protein n=1 Tax=Petromyces alliaceus TaxID=209559 RepID=A0A5N7CQV0_PETAA|nr:kinase-like domain-containing protein [Aspergillus alliaceus]
MAVTPKLGSPIELPSDFVKSGSPYDQLNRFFVGLSPTWGPVSAIEFSEGSHLAYVYQERIEERDLQAEDFKETSHPNLVNFKEVFIAKQNVFFLYDTWGISLEEIQQSSSKFCLGEVQFATISKGILQALKYVHEVLGICHGNVTLSTVLINQEGVVKLADVGSSLIREPRRRQKSKDLQAVCSIARSLLRLDETSAIRGTMGLLAEDFTGCSGRATAADPLKHPFLRISLGPWCLRPVSVLCGIAR